MRRALAAYLAAAALAVTLSTMTKNGQFGVNVELVADADWPCGIVSVTALTEPCAATSVTVTALPRFVRIAPLAEARLIIDVNVPEPSSAQS